MIMLTLSSFVLVNAWERLIDIENSLLHKQLILSSSSGCDAEIAIDWTPKKDLTLNCLLNVKNIIKRWTFLCLDYIFIKEKEILKESRNFQKWKNIWFCNFQRCDDHHVFNDISRKKRHFLLHQTTNMECWPNNRHKPNKYCCSN